MSLDAAVKDIKHGHFAKDMSKQIKGIVKNVIGDAGKKWPSFGTRPSCAEPHGLAHGGVLC